MKEGWIKIHYKILEWEWYGDPNMVALWIHLLISANWKDKKWRGMTIKRGQLLTSRAHLAEETGLSEQQVRRCLTRLQESEEITCETTNRNTMITICKYESYQGEAYTNQPAEQPTNNQQTTNEQPTSNQQTTTTEEYNNIKNFKNSRKKDGGVAPAPDGFDFETYGIMENVKLKPSQYRHLVESYGEEATNQTLDEFSCKLADGSTDSGNHYATLTYWLSYQQKTNGVPLSSKTATQTPTYTPPKQERELTDAEKAIIKEWKQYTAQPRERSEKYDKLKEISEKHGGIAPEVLTALGMIQHNGRWLFN